MTRLRLIEITLKPLHPLFWAGAFCVVIASKAKSRTRRQIEWRKMRKMYDL